MRAAPRCAAAGSAAVVPHPHPLADQRFAFKYIFMQNHFRFCKTLFVSRNKLGGRKDPVSFGDRPHMVARPPARRRPRSRWRKRRRWPLPGLTEQNEGDGMKKVVSQTFLRLHKLSHENHLKLRRKVYEILFDGFRKSCFRHMQLFQGAPRHPCLGSPPF